jgi:hypothetical protein
MQVICLSPTDVVALIDTLVQAKRRGLHVRVAVEDGLKVSVAGDVWPLPYGTDTTGWS